jgi:drug/metabolite transporter (DMT)-like permease
MFCSSLLDTIAFIASSWAIKHSDISLLSPLSSSTPIFATFFGALFLHEIPTATKLLGILTIVCGMYLLHIADVRGGIFKPFQKLLSDKGVRLYFIAAVLWGITPIFQKQAIFQTHPIKPLFASFFGFFLVTLYLSFYTIPKVKSEGSFVAKQTWLFILYGLLSTLAQLAAYTVFAMTQVGYATAVFSLSSLFSILFGAMFLKERRIKERLLGASVMLVGITLLAF